MKHWVGFTSDAEEIFKKANVTKEQAPEMYDDVITILSGKMATLSATMGLSYARLDAYDEQKSSLINDLVKMKVEGHLR